MEKQWSAEARRTEIMRILESGRSETMSSFASYFGVATRTIGYDIAVLTAKHPIETIRGKNGGVKLKEGYRSYQNALRADEQEALIAIIPSASKEYAALFKGLLIRLGSKENQKRIERIVT